MKTTQEKPWYLTPAEGEGWRASQPRLLSELGLDSLVVARLLEWFAIKIWVAQEEGSGEREYYGKSYDPLKVELSTNGGGTAHSYVFNLKDGGRHHGFQSLEELEIALTDELIGVVAWAMRRASEDAFEGLARHFWLEENPGEEERWESYDELDYEQRKPYYERAQQIIKSGRD